jgi:peptidoglycan/LPS O-acetylase OafA/YrhL
MDIFSNHKGVLGCPRNDSPREYLKYRPDIDGLRAFAILSVVLYHAFPSFMRGGFIGVNVFLLFPDI